MNRDRKKSLIKFGVALFLLSQILVMAGAQDQSPDTNDSAEPTQIQTIDLRVAGGIVVIVFALLIIMGYFARERGSLGAGEMRRAIAGTFVVGFTVIVILSYISGVCQKEIIFAYIELVGIVIGFYFGARTAEEKRLEAAVKIDIEHVRFLSDPQKIAITIRNGGPTDIVVDKVYISEEPFKTGIKIDPQKSEEHELPYKWEFETEYTIKIATTTGLTAKISIKSPKEKSQGGE